MKGKVKGASRLLSTDSGAMILPQDQMIDGKPVRDVLREKHPTALLQQEGEARAPPHHPMMFDEINGLCILKSALKTEGGAGPSGVRRCKPVEKNVLFIPERIVRAVCGIGMCSKENLLLSS